MTIKAGPLTVVVSDLHGNFEGLDPSGADVVVLAGDIVPLRRDFEKIPNTIARTIWC